MFAFFQDKRENEQPQLNGRLIKLPIENVKPNPNQPRRRFDPAALSELAHSIADHGLMQPVVVRFVGDRYELIAGERRWRACNMVGMTQIDAIVVDADSEQSACLALIENLHRTDLHFFEVAESYAALMNLYGLTQEQLAERIGKKQSTIANKLRVSRMSAAVKDAIIQGGLTERHARALLRLEDESEQIQLIQKVVGRALSVKETEAMVNQIMEGEPEELPHPRVVRLVHDYRLFVNTLKAAVKDLQEAGVEASFQVDEGESEVSVTVSIPKRMTS